MSSSAGVASQATKTVMRRLLFHDLTDFASLFSPPPDLEAGVQNFAGHFASLFAFRRSFSLDHELSHRLGGEDSHAGDCDGMSEWERVGRQVLIEVAVGVTGVTCVPPFAGKDICGRLSSLFLFFVPFTISPHVLLPSSPPPPHVSLSVCM